MWTLRTLHRKQEAQAPEGGAAPAASAPAQAPAAQPAAPAQPVPTPAPAQTPKLNYDNPAAKQVGDMLSGAGVDPLKARDAIAANGGTCTPEIYAALEAKHGAGMASLLANQMSALHKSGVDKGNAADNAVYDQVKEAFKGVTEQTGQETFAELSTWAKTNIPNDQRKELNAVIAQGGMGAKLAIQELINAFQNSGDYSQEMVGIEGDNVPNAPKGGDLTRNEYNTELDALLAKGHNYETSQQIKQLQARRAKSAQRGI